MENPVLVVELYEPEEAARFLAATSIGLLKSISDKVMTLAEAERLLFSPRTVRVLGEKGISSELCGIIMDCCELDDILDLLPLKFDVELNKMIERFSNYIIGTVAQDPYAAHARLK
ncbi:MULTISPECIES: DUF3969 family protein [Pseudomonas]|uniref:DUF3969 family protein n=1 Tax=Pseudomonas TaxID=286 RepID=UPI001C655DD7|nr:MULTISPECIES: DUF3969 family protein [Pseudomonas]MBW8130272.1 DUF3969 family protein [Pseudomonas sp. LAP_36]MBW8139410.1 DUF3969 family protein [Pseudomonas sp. PAMC 26818]MCM2378187.1 DUF3969 family protein [Pseudomonas marginalis]